MLTPIPQYTLWGVTPKEATDTVGRGVPRTWGGQGGRPSPRLLSNPDHLPQGPPGSSLERNKVGATKPPGHLQRSSTDWGRPERWPTAPDRASLARPPRKAASEAQGLPESSRALGCMALCPAVRMETPVSRQTLPSRASWAQCCPGCFSGPRTTVLHNQVCIYQKRPDSEGTGKAWSQLASRPITQAGGAAGHPSRDRQSGVVMLWEGRDVSALSKHSRAQGWGGQRGGQHREGCPCLGECQVNLWAHTSSGRGRRKAALGEPHAPALQNPAPDLGTRPERRALAATWPPPKNPSCRFISKHANTQTQRATGN